MLPIDFHFQDNEAPHILCLGAHGDDIEIGALATILELATKYTTAKIDWVVFSANGARQQEARSSAEYCTSAFEDADIEVHNFRDGHFPYDAGSIKVKFEAIKNRLDPDIIFTHYRHDRHQDHAVVSDLTWQTFRNHLILEYEIPKYDGDLGKPNVFSMVSEQLKEDKLAVLNQFFASQKTRSWFVPETFSALMRLRGIECNSTSGFAEAFYCRKLLLS